MGLCISLQTESGEPIESVFDEKTCLISYLDSPTQMCFLSSPLSFL
jgi:hypothetical protein